MTAWGIALLALVALGLTILITIRNNDEDDQ